MNDEKSINRVIEKLFKKDLIKKREEKDQMNLSVKTMAEFYQKEKELFEKALREIMENKEILVFSLTDMLRGKCLFESVDEINECVSELKEQIEKKGYQLVEIDNRLTGKTNTSDIVLKIRIGETITELQLVIRFNEIQNSFSHKIYEIMRSQFYEEINFLQLYNGTVSYEYAKKLTNIIAHNNKNMAQ